jgi:hypothetical protein
MQWFWFGGTVLFFGAVLLDVLNVLNVLTPLLIAIPPILLAINLAVGPSMKQLSKGNRRG